MPVTRVLHVIPSVGPLRGGPSTMVRQLAGQLAEAGVQTHVATTDDNADGTLNVCYGAASREGGVTYWYFPRQLRFYTVSWPLGAWLRRHVAEFDVVHIHALFSYATLPAAFWAARHGIPYVVRPLGTLNDWGMKNRRPWLKKASYRLLESKVITRAALMHYTSDQERIEAERLGVTTPSVVIPIGLAEPAPTVTRGAFRRRLGVHIGRPIVLFLSRIDEKKGLDLLLRAFSDIRRHWSDALLVVAGDGPPAFVTRMKSEAHALGLSDDALVWAGFLRGDSKAAALADADVFALPSYSENFGIAVAEAMAAHVPVVVSDQVGIWRDVQAAGAGVVVPCDAAALSGALAGLLASPERRLEMGERGAALVRDTYSAQSVTRQMLDAYRRVVDHRIPVQGAA